ncbi:MAG TPA: M15 family metallopeptidase, partial [Polyangiaceae bacterium]
AERNTNGPTAAERNTNGPTAAERNTNGAIPRVSAKRPTRVRSWPSRRAIGLCFAVLAMCAIIAIAVVDIVRSASQRNAIMQPGLQQPSGVAPPQSSAQTAPSADTAPEEQSAEASIFDEEGVEDKSSSTKAPKHFATVQDAAARSCTTASVEGLSRQIISEARCISPNALVALPPRPNLLLSPQVLPYLDVEARDHLVRALDAHRDRTMTVHSALRTVAQQYLVWRWSANKRCGVPLATSPGDSNHESGLAVDIAEQAVWRPMLEAQGFKWLGASDKVHFDYKGAGASTHRSVDVLAFQRLWNRNHADDTITADGRYGAPTEQRLKKAPPDGFRIGSTCGKGKIAKRSGP